MDLRYCHSTMVDPESTRRKFLSRLRLSVQFVGRRLSESVSEVGSKVMRSLSPLPARTESWRLLISTSLTRKGFHEA